MDTKKAKRTYSQPGKSWKSCDPLTLVEVAEDTVHSEEFRLFIQELSPEKRAGFEAVEELISRQDALTRALGVTTPSTA